MKILINSNFKALRQGEFVEANEDAGEFILDTDNKDKAPAKATIQEIAKANKITLKSKVTIADALDIIAEALTETLPEQNEMTDSQKVEEIVKAGVEAGLSDDDMLVQIIQEGIPFRAAGRLFKKVMEESGLRISSAKRKEQIVAILEDAEFAPETYDEIKEMLERIEKEVADTTTSQALKIIKRYAKDLEIELPKVPRAPTGGIRTKLFDLVKENPAITKAEVEDFFSENCKTEEAAAKYMKRYYPIIEFGQEMHKLGTGEE